MLSKKTRRGPCPLHHPWCCAGCCPSPTAPPPGDTDHLAATTSCRQGRISLSPAGSPHCPHSPKSGELHPHSELLEPSSLTHWVDGVWDTGDCALQGLTATAAWGNMGALLSMPPSSASCSTNCCFFWLPLLAIQCILKNCMVCLNAV